MNICDQAKEKVAIYRLEADIRRQLPRKLWRVELAHVFRGLAERLEPTPTVPAS